MLRCFGKANEEVMRVVSRGERDSEHGEIDGGGGGGGGDDGPLRRLL